MNIHYFNCRCQGHYGDWMLYQGAKKTFQSLDDSVNFVTHPENADLLLFGGGTVLGRFYWKKFYELDKPTAVYGSGIATEHLPDELQKLLRNSLKVGVRGLFTQKILAEHNIDSEVIGDLIFSVDPPTVEKEPGLVVGGIRKDAGKLTRRYFREVYDYLEEQGYRVELYRMGGNDRGRLGNRPAQLNPYEETINNVCRSGLVVGMRLHMTLLALIAGIKTVGFEYAWWKLKDSLSVLDYPYYVSHLPATDNPLVVFAPLYKHLIEDGDVMDKIKEKAEDYRALQRKFAQEILTAYVESLDIP